MADLIPLKTSLAGTPFDADLNVIAADINRTNKKLSRILGYRRIADSAIKGAIDGRLPKVSPSSDILGNILSATYKFEDDFSDPDDETPQKNPMINATFTFSPWILD